MGLANECISNQDSAGTDEILTIVKKDQSESLSKLDDPPLNILSLVINNKAWKCYSVLKGSQKFQEYVKNVGHIDLNVPKNWILRMLLNTT